MIAALDTAISTAGVSACCRERLRATLRVLGETETDDGFTWRCRDCRTVLELHGRVWLNQRFAPDREGLA